MDLYSRLHAINHTPDMIQARQLRRARRQREIYDRIGEAIGPTQAAVQWSLHQRDPEMSAGAPIGSQHPGHAAIIAARNALADYELPTAPDFRFIGMKRFSGHGGHQIYDGVVTVEVELKSLSGVAHVVDVPVIVKEGRVLEPVVVVDRGVIKAMTQHTFDEILDMGTFHAPVPQRLNMFSPPPEERGRPREVPIVRPGLFGIGPVNRMITGAYVRSALTGHYVTDMPSFVDARRAALDPAEREVSSICAGDTIHLKRAVDLVGRDGSRWHFNSGTKGEVQRDMDGTGQWYAVYFPEVGFAAVVSADVIK